MASIEAKADRAVSQSPLLQTLQDVYEMGMAMTAQNTEERGEPVLSSPDERQEHIGVKRDVQHAGLNETDSNSTSGLVQLLKSNISSSETENNRSGSLVVSWRPDNSDSTYANSWNQLNGVEKLFVGLGLWIWHGTGLAVFLKRLIN
ncbi:Hypothetical predicted protein [Lecanosticta acicola]|uniref:Uncharacterized protein n=1 Tax=Lecanosticta acicola TaxID=111012 RepID=A0AAI8Z1P6_9PEZI|nr:Hypothetical predicted protein [Lecanosticta acicola]